jgi:uncharacterized membrane protein (UPF0127 family)
MTVIVSACATSGPTVEGFETTEITVDDQALTVLVAETSSQRSQGLMDIENLPDDIDGMLFLYEAPASVAFHMLNTPMPLDIWWFDVQAELIGYTEMEPCLIEPCVTYGSPGQVVSVLETPLDVFDFKLSADLSTIDSG